MLGTPKGDVPPMAPDVYAAGWKKRASSRLAVATGTKGGSSFASHEVSHLERKGDVCEEGGGRMMMMMMRFDEKARLPWEIRECVGKPVPVLSSTYVALRAALHLEEKEAVSEFVTIGYVLF